MRVVWIVGGADSFISKLKEAFKFDRLQVEYLIRRANSVEEIPASHLAHPGVTFLLDCFHPQFPGLDGLKAFQKAHCKGNLFLFGEPAPESAVEAFQNFNLAGFFPSMDRAEPYLVAGIVHSKLYFSGKLKIEHFLSPAGKTSVENVKNLHEFNAFQSKLGAFVGRFGIDLNQLKKVLMGLSLAHVKASPAGPTIEQSFPIFYGMDPKKVCIAMPAFSKGATRQVLMSEFCGVLSGLNNSSGHNSNFFPEIGHVTKAAGNLVIYSGTALAPEGQRDPMLLMATLPFPVKQEKQSPLYNFTMAFVSATDEMTPEEANETATPGSTVPPVVSKAAAPQADGPRTLEAVDIQKILSEPTILGDKPKVIVEATVDPGDILPETSFERDPPPEAEKSQVEAVSPELANEALLLSQQEVQRLKDEVQVLSQDVRRLMKERRQPTTDRELRDAFQQIEEKLKSMQQERFKLVKDIETRDKQIQILKTQIEDIKKNKAAA